jgi:hypothetical protein
MHEIQFQDRNTHIWNNVSIYCLRGSETSDSLDWSSHHLPSTHLGVGRCRAKRGQILFLGVQLCGGQKWAMAAFSDAGLSSSAIMIGQHPKSYVAVAAL